MHCRSFSLRDLALVGGLVVGWVCGVVDGAPARHLGSADANTCVGGAVDWYTQSMGETPCVTYQRLRQQCNPGFQTPNMPLTVPPDQCNDQRQHCCCNSLAFGLAMLCMNCQHGNGTTPDNGIDAGLGAYSTFGSTCHTLPQNDSFSSKLNEFICSSTPSIPQYLVDTSFYTTGQWFYNKTMTEATQEISIGNSPTACNTLSSDGSNVASVTLQAGTMDASSGAGIPSTTSSVDASATSTPSDTSNADPSSHLAKPQVSAGAVAAGVVGGLASLVALVIVFFLCRLRRKRGRIFSPKGSEPVHGDEFRSTPFTYSRPGSAAPPVTTEVNRHSFTSVGHSIEPSRTDFSQSPPSSPPPIPHRTFASQIQQPQPQLVFSSAAATSRNADRLDLTAGEVPSRRLTPSEQRDSYRNPGSKLYPFWATSSKHTSSTSAPSEAGDEGERIRDSVLRSFNPIGMVRQSPPMSPRTGGSPGGRYVVNR